MAFLGNLSFSSPRQSQKVLLDDLSFSDPRNMEKEIEDEHGQEPPFIWFFHFISIFHLRDIIQKTEGV